MNWRPTNQQLKQAVSCGRLKTVSKMNMFNIPNSYIVTNVFHLLLQLLGKWEASTDKSEDLFPSRVGAVAL
jgi:hypothetical protein